MKCGKCGAPTSMVANRTLKSGIVKRVRRCARCNERFCTYEIKETDIKSMIRDFEPEVHYNKESLCWSCERATGFCSWSRNFEPVPGWEAEPTEVKNTYKKGYFEMVASYDVKACPLYIKDNKRKEERK
jgi:hypothetical protein